MSHTTTPTKREPCVFTMLVGFDSFIYGDCFIVTSNKIEKRFQGGSSMMFPQVSFQTSGFPTFLRGHVFQCFSSRFHENVRTESLNP